MIIILVPLLMSLVVAWVHPCELVLVELSETVHDTIYRVFLAASMFLLTSCMLSFTLSTRAYFDKKLQYT